MKATLSLLTLSALFFGSLNAQEKPLLPEVLKPHRIYKAPHHSTTFKRTGPTVQIGILLDTSGSMNGLIDQAKEQLWKIVNEVAKANKHNKDVTIQVGLFEYGKDSLPRYEGYLQMLSPLTSDLDKVSEALFGLRINGGEEYAGKVILESINRFAWSSHKDDLKLLIIAGNESFAQGNIPYKRAIEKARANGIIVNTIFCGDAREGQRLEWAKGASLGHGRYFNINHNQKREYIPSPYDDEIIMLGNSLNETYMNYGTAQKRHAKSANTLKQDANTKAMSKASFVERNIVKSKKQYTQASEDMVTAYMENAPMVATISKEELPDELKGKSQKEITQLLEKKKEQRVNVQKKIKKLEAKRDVFIAKQKHKKSDKDLGSAIVQSIRKQATKNGFVFKK